MKKRVLSIVCVIALIATMISAGAIFAIGTDTVALEGEAFAFAGTSFVDTDWTATNNTPTFGEDGVKLKSVDDTAYATIKYKDSYNLTNGFTLEYVAKAKAQSSTINAGTYFTGVQIGNVTVAMDQFIKPVILVDGAVKATGTAIYTGDDIRNGWVNGEEPEIDEIKYTVTYDVNNKTLTYARYHGTTQVFSLVYTDTTRLIDVEAADVVLYHNNNKRSYATYKSIKLTGASADSVVPPSVLYGTGVEFGDTIAPVASDWTLSGSSSKVNSDHITLNNGNTDVYINGTYNNTFVLTDGFTLTYKANGRYYNNYANNKTYLGVTVGNITAGLELADGAAVVLKIKVDGATVATSDPIFDENHSSWKASDSKAANMNYFFGSYARELSLNYDPATKTLTYAEGNIAATYVDDADAIDVNDVTVGFKHHASWSGYGVYKAFKLVGATCTEHVYDDDNDTTCNNCGATRTIGGEGDGEGDGEGEDEPAIERGDALTETWAPEMIEDEWTGSVSNLVDGAFVLKKEGESVTKTIWSVNEFDLSAGFKFTGSLTMSNSYNNFYGEWCSAYFGNESEYLELRLKNDSPNNTAKVRTYTAYILYNGEILASSSMAELVNGTYELTYKDGKVSVKFKDVAIDWTLADETVATEVAVDANLAKAKVGLRLVNNYHPDGRKWAKISIAPIATAGEGEGEDDVVKGETLTKWEPEEFLEEDWMDSEGKFSDGKFLIVSGNGTKTIWTEKNYDLSGGFKFKGKLAMKNGYNNYENEWCSAYFGNEDVNLELRVRNDDTTPKDADKDNTYTAYIIYKGKTLASCDLVTIPNGEYELSYKDGKVSVNLGGSALKWTLDGTETTATSIDVADIDLVNAKLGLRLTGNWCPNGRQWSEISLVSLASGSGAVSTGDARNIVFPAAVMLVCAVAVAFVSLRKKVRA